MCEEVIKTVLYEECVFLNGDHPENTSGGAEATAFFDDAAGITVTVYGSDVILISTRVRVDGEYVVQSKYVFPGEVLKSQYAQVIRDCTKIFDGLLANHPTLRAKVLEGVE